MTKRPILYAGLFAASLALATTGAKAEMSEDDAAALYSRMHQSIAAAESCRKLDFGDEAHSKMAKVINTAVEGELGAGKRLSLIEDAERRARGLVSKKGCDSPEVMELLGVFDAKLAPAL